MRNDKHLAEKLRRKGLSYNKISQELEVPKSTLSGWFSQEKWSRNLKDELTRKANYTNHRKFRKYVKQRQRMWEAWREAARQEARQKFPELAKDPLFIAGIMLYWGEGDSNLKNGMVALSNTDPAMIVVYAKFLRDICKVPPNRMKAQMILYPDLDETTCLDHWCKAAGIPTTHFYKTQYIQGRHPTKRLSHGICMIKFGDRRLKEKIAVWIQLFYQAYSPLAARPYIQYK